MKRIIIPLNFCIILLLSPLLSAAEGNKIDSNLQWSPQETTRNIAIKNLSVTSNASFHWIRLMGAESPHVHDSHDLTVFIFSGTSAIHFSEKTIMMHPGDLIEIPRGTWHWAENHGPSPTQAYAIFHPPFDGKDKRIQENP